ncbi:(Fe-S)-binding protein [Desulfohalovibrio reitneri]|uniref:(Fe-S)-binding protein n=1 Tax=Desulfohalovibrio reitneri TaxID=1307759 RepID=UPI0004A72C95|nr:(Fe-S)-binding protein [Desulfohalovibrio reitneri]
MAEIQELIKLLGELDDELVGCMRCGMCQAQCPVFAQTGREADVARGKLALLDGLAHEMIKDPKGVKERLDRCLLCGSCQAACPSGVKVVDIFLKARAILTGYMGLPPAKKVIFQQLMTRPQLFDKIVGLGSRFQGVFSKKASEVMGTSCARFASPLGDRHYPNLADKPFHKTQGELNEPRGSSGMRVAFFPGCVTDKVYPRVAEATLKVLRHHGVGIYLPHGQACCGIPALSSGERKSFEKMVETNLSLFEKGDFDYIITVCATCAATLKDVWPMMVEDDTRRERAKAMSGKVMDISQFLVDVLGVEPGEAHGGKKVTYHDPCHLRNSLKVTAQPRNVLKASRGVEFTEMPEAATCCGCGGSFSLEHYDLSRTIGQRKAENVGKSGAELAATSCPACMMQISDMLSQKGENTPVRHVVEVYAEGLK